MAAGAISAKRTQLLAAQTAAPPPASSRWQTLVYFAALVFLAVFAVGKFAPDFLADINQWFNPWLATANRQRVLRGKLRAEEESFDKFVASLRAGPATAATETDPRKEFFPLAAKLLATQRALVQDTIRETGGLARNTILSELRDSLTALKNHATFPEVLPVWQLASALEGLLQQLTAKMGNVTPSTLRAVIGGVDLLDDLCAPGLKPDLLANRPLKFLVVDDDWVSRQALSQSLQKAFSPPELCADGAAALLKLGEQTYDVIFLDVQMPEMDGFELCLKIRATILNRTTPVVFVSSQSDFNARAKSTLSGGNELLGKPFLTFEITVKALTLALHGRLHGREVKPPTAVAAGRGLEDSWLSLLGETTSAPAKLRAPQLVSAATGSEDFNTAFLTRTANHLTPLRELCGKLLLADEASRPPLLVDAFLRINSLISKTDPEMDHPAYQFSVVLEGLLRKLLEHSKNSTPSALATVAAAVDLLADLCAAGLTADFLTQPPVRLLVVDDDLVARRVITGALQTAFEKPESVEDGETAVALAAEKPFDVIFLDVVMPGTDGFEVCQKIRNTIPNCLTPVIFVSGQEDNAALRDRMHRSGGNEFLGKPFLTAELTVKTLTLALRGRLKQLAPPPIA